ncbi:phosphoesterase [Legionella israelensis]|uniref:Component of the Dot/Icm secretion system, predicted inner membrane protein n=1 Tax=Legionella israelensis TaxID=454 RepID=A0A0W0W957_9GAMM|nr:type IVB secretion system protein IcmM/DotJ [Legionella israelensis]KTD28718.1 Component of the Dot/Icm secretion system, predicted inner membrane protein [Legionella israelensis]QBR83241.1 phosphoesterase [Legionella israelensis]QBS09382.1 phosphoesterase [Legionella israelensis]QDP71770.1 phosphoesterase [Legionella israelensis]SCX88775.1 intracellular multiplication protein IcmM [Legionella israelensis DSM 19235]
MSRYSWSIIKQSKFFYIQSFRRAGIFLFISLVLNTIFSLAIYFAYTNQPERDFYASNGITAPIKLKPMLTPNYSSEAMLAPDPVNTEDVRKVIPQ